VHLYYDCQWRGSNNFEIWLKDLIFQVDEMYREAPISKGMFNYIEFTRILKHGAKEKDEV